jgi:cell volume regulation protein A
VGSALHEVLSFGIAVLMSGVVITVGLLGRRVARFAHVPAPAIFLVAAAVVAALSSAVRHTVDLRMVVDVVTLALVVILFDGGLHLGPRRFKAAAVPIVLLGVFGTFATTALIGVAAHGIFGLPWKIALVLGAALAPTDPAVVFSVLANKALSGRTGAVLEGESGFNDPAGIALLLGFASLATHPHGSFTTVLVTFAVEMGVGAAIGVAGGYALSWLVNNRDPLAPAHDPLRVLGGVLLLYGITTVARGSGFLAVLIAGIMMGRDRENHGRSIERFHATLADLGEIGAFILLGLSIPLTSVGERWAWLIGITLAVIIAFVLRPIATLPLLLGVRMPWRERVFISWAGLKGAVPILLGALAVREGVPDARRIYAVVFVVVLISVAAQGGSLGFVARKLGVPMHDAEDPGW